VSDPFNLQRFIDAQQAVFSRVCAELAAGRKESHWMWFVFPQLAGLGSSSTARHYAIGSLEEACAYLAHPILGPRLRQCTGLVNRIEGRPIEKIFGYPDYLKFRSCMTLFARAGDEAGNAGRARPVVEASGVGDSRVFEEALSRYFAGEGDPLTLRLLPSAS
jgi:uncharacterized protein (DUF1810 family)